MAIRTYRICRAAIFLFSLILFICAPAGAKIIYVDDDDTADFNNIQTTVNDSNDGDIIEVAPEIYARQFIQNIDFMNKDIIIRPNNPEAVYISTPLSGDPNAVQSNLTYRHNYVPGELIIKFRKTAAASIANWISEERRMHDLKLSNSLDELNEKYKVRDIKALFKDFKQNRQRVQNLLKKDKALLTKREKRILQRLKRAPEKATVPTLDSIYKLRFDLEPGQFIQDVLAAYNNDPAVEYAELNYIVSIDSTPNDPLYTVQWPLNNIGQMYPESGRYNPPPGTPDCDIDAPEAWDIHIGSSEIIVAVVDTGIDYTHRDLQGNIWINEAELNGVAGVDDDGNEYIDDIYGYDFINNDSDPKDDHGHGTHCSGVIAAKSNNGLDISGVCWHAKIMGLKFLSSRGSGPISDAIEAFYYAVNNGADVISNSWGGGYVQAAQDAVDYAYSQGVIVTASAGNNGDTTHNYPADYEHVISVAATNSNDERAPFSSYGDWVDIAAPGVDVLSLRATGTSMGTTYDSYTTIASGTSMACPHVSGACALLLSLYPEGTVDEVTNILKVSADPIDSGICQSGRLNIDKAILKMVTPEGRLWLDKELYSCSGTMEISITDSDLKGAGAENVSLTTDGNDFETVTLLENGTNTGIFGGSIGLSGDAVVVEDGTLQVAHGQMITAMYYDATDGTGNPATVEDTAVVDCVIPVVLDVNATLGPTGRSVTVRVESDEPTVAEVSCGLACGGPYDIIRADSTIGTSHTIKLLPLTSETDYYFVIGLMDAAGNQTFADNKGVCYWFTTPEFLGFLVPSVYPTIQAAIDDTWDGDTVWVADGIYTGEGNRDIDFLGKAITVRSENGPGNCVIDCNNLGRGFDFNSEETENAVLDGFTIINGNASEGGGIRCLGVQRLNQIFPSSPTIRNCIIYDCKASIGGGIHFCHSLSSLSGCDISYNDGGGGIYSAWYGVDINECRIVGNIGNGIYGNFAKVNDCTITDNGSTGVSFGRCSPLITKCTISNNGSSGILFSDSVPVISNCIITDNGSTGVSFSNSNPVISGCIVANHKSSGITGSFASMPTPQPFTVTDCTISNNHASGISYNLHSIILSNSIIVGNFSSDNGGGLCSDAWDEGATVKNCVFIGNYAKQKGGGIYSNNAGNTYVNCTIVDNTADECGGGYYCQNEGYRYFTNCIFWGNSAPVGPQMAIGGGYADVVVSHSDVQGGQGQIPVLVGNSSLTWGGDNIDADPCFALPGDYHQLNSSPCIDAGTNSPTGGLPATDVYGSPRSQDGDGNGSAIADMGAYEFEYGSNTPVIAISQEFFDFYNFNNRPNPDEQYFSIRNCAGGMLNWEISDDCFWLETVPDEGSSTTEVNEVAIRVDTTTLSHGEYTCKIMIADSNAINSPRIILVKLHVADSILVPENFPTIQEAIDATGDKSTIIVADGVYAGIGNKNISFKGKAITVKSENGPDNCIIDCQSSGRGFIFNTYEEDNSILDGFTIINGFSSDFGGGVYISNSSPNVRNCRIIDCRTTGIFGGGVYCENSAVKIIGCCFENNRSAREGGGLYFNKGGYALVDRCVFYNNTTSGSYEADGGAICVRNDDERFATIRNSLMYENAAGRYGGAIYLTSTSTKIYNCTIMNNSANSSGGGIFFDCSTNRTPSLKNCILWNNTPGQIDYTEPVSRITYNDVQDGWAGTGNISTDPCFFDAANNDYHLRWNSPCINKGDPAYTAGEDELDVDSEPRIMGGRIDMGFDEVEERQADLSRNGIIDFEDIMLFVQAWLSSPGDDNWCILCDLYPDNKIDFGDWAELAQNWLWQADWYEP